MLKNILVPNFEHIYPRQKEINPRYLGFQIQIYLIVAKFQTKTIDNVNTKASKYNVNTRQ